MAQWIALLRGINVGGRNTLPMADLRALLEGLGAEGVRTYIQSGNAVFRSPARGAAALEEGIAAAVESERGFRPGVRVLRPAQVRAALDGSPWASRADSKQVHVSFLGAKPAPGRLEALRELATAGEEVELDGKCLHLHTPNGMARSKLAAAIEARLGVPATTRNLRTVAALVELCDPG